MDIDHFGYPDSPTQNWLAANADLSPLRILDNINLKSEFPYSVSTENDKPPDISNIGMDHTTANLLQFAASVPVPDHTTSFLDIGLDSFQSLYEDHLIGDLIPVSSSSSASTSNAFSNASNNEHSFSVSKQNAQQRVVATTAIPFSPCDKQENQLDLKSLGIQIPLPGVSCGETTISAVQHPPALKSLVEPLPASALQGLIKIEPCAVSSPNFNPNLIKQEETCENLESYSSSYSPLPMQAMMSPGSPTPSTHSIGGGGKMKTPSRKKSTASTDEEDDISNIPSLQMRIQIIQQRVSYHKIASLCPNKKKSVEVINTFFVDPFSNLQQSQKPAATIKVYDPYYCQFILSKEIRPLKVYNFAVVAAAAKCIRNATYFQQGIYRSII